ncbi:MAG: hypothetical protein JRH11_12220 [Deltaproteobacteria bacterium]|nr:hypothetical protein [Deltaproteobacteria bacterium]
MGGIACTASGEPVVSGEKGEVDRGCCELAVAECTYTNRGYCDELADRAGGGSVFHVDTSCSEIVCGESFMESDSDYGCCELDGAAACTSAPRGYCRTLADRAGSGFQLHVDTACSAVAACDVADPDADYGCCQLVDVGECTSATRGYCSTLADRAGSAFELHVDTACSEIAACSLSAPEPLCNDSCEYSGDDDCDDGGSGSDYDLCELGTDCEDCGTRNPS